MILNFLSPLTVTSYIIRIGQEQSVKPFSLLSANRSTAYGGTRGGPADYVIHHQISRREIMGSIILTGLSHRRHKVSLNYPDVEGIMICRAQCKCGYKVEFINFRNYGSGNDLQMKWEEHIGTWKGWV